MDTEGHDEPAVAEMPNTPGTPEMVRPKPGGAGDLPIKTGRHRTLGIKVRGRTSFYFVATHQSFSSRYARRFPLTPEGWRDAWAAFVAEDPDAAHAWLHPRETSSAPDTSLGSQPIPAAAQGGKENKPCESENPGAASDLSRPSQTALGGAMLAGAALVFALSSMLQAVGHSSMFSSDYPASDNFIQGLLVNLTFYPGWIATVALGGLGLLSLAGSLMASEQTGSEPADAGGDE